MRATLIALAFAVVATAADAQILEMNGTWEYRPDKSIGPGPVQETLFFQNQPGVQKYTMTAVQDDGSRSRDEWEINYDGKDYPTRREGATASIVRLGEKTEFVVNKREGEISTTYTRVLVDHDRTIISIGRDAAGVIQWVRVFEKR